MADEGTAEGIVEQGGQTAPEQAPEGGQEQQQGIPPEITARLDELSQFKDQVEPLLQPQEIDPMALGQEGYEEPYDPSQQYGDQYGQGEVLDEYGNPVESYDPNQEMLQQAVGPLAERLQQTEGLVQQLQTERQEDELNSLTIDYPQLDEPEVQEAVAQDVNQQAMEYAQRLMSQGIPQEFVQRAFDAYRMDPGVVERTYLSKYGGNGAAQEAPAGDSQVQLESGSGAAPSQPAQTDADIAQGIVAAGNGGRLLPL
jgi:hypothetical protein